VSPSRRPYRHAASWGGHPSSPTIGTRRGCPWRRRPRGERRAPGRCFEIRQSLRHAFGRRAWRNPCHLYGRIRDNQNTPATRPELVKRRLKFDFVMRLAHRSTRALAQVKVLLHLDSHNENRVSELSPIRVSGQPQDSIVRTGPEVPDALRPGPVEPTRSCPPIPTVGRAQHRFVSHLAGGLTSTKTFM
jgi:hypothetical protein